MAYYVIRQGRQTGIFTDRDQVKSFVSWYPQAKYKKFTTQHEAENALKQGRVAFYTKKEDYFSSLTMIEDWIQKCIVEKKMALTILQKH